MELAQRQRDILEAIIRHYISEGAPVGSNAVAERLTEPLSSATIRNCMAELEDSGFLAQPHVSAGRVPTDKAYRFYVDRLIGSARLGRMTKRYIDENLKSHPDAPEELMAETSRVLSEISQNIGLALGSAREEKLLEHIKFVSLSERRVLVVIVSKPDLIENKVVRMDEDFSQAELDRTADYLNGEFRGWSLMTIRHEMLKRMEEMKHLCDHLITNVAKLLVWGTLAEETPGPVFVEGTAKLLDRAEFNDVAKIKDLLATLEEKAKVVKILGACLNSSNCGVRILIGHENPSSEMKECSLIVAPLHYRSHAIGAVGIVGPTRMEYGRAISAVDYAAHSCSKLLATN